MSDERETSVENSGTALTAPVEGAVSTRRPGQFYPGDPRAALGTPAAKAKGALVFGGRPKSVTRHAARMAFDERISFLTDVIDGKPLEFRKQVRYKKVELQDHENPSDPGVLEAGKVITNTFTVTETSKSAEVEERLAAMEMLGKMGGVNLPVDEGEEKDPDAPPPVFIISFD